MSGMLSESALGVMGSFALDVLIKATVLGLVAFLVHAALGRKAVLARSMLWNATLVGWLLLPITAAMFPQLRIACLPSRVATEFDDVQMASQAAEVPITDRPVPAARPAALPSPLLAEITSKPNESSGRAAMTVLSELTAIGLAAYAALALALVLRLGIGLSAIERLRGSTRRIDLPVWNEALERWRGRLGIERRVELATSGQVGVPVVVGWLRPLIVVPHTLVDRSARVEIDAVLVHELAHVRRADFLWNCLLKLVQALYWPHPLVWLSGRLIGRVREEACDNVCIHWLGDATAYRSTLLELAAGLLPRPAESLGLAMSRSTNLGRRLARLERSRGASRCVSRWPARTAAIVLVAVGVSLLGPARLAQTSAQVPGGAEKKTKTEDDNLRPRPVSPPAQEKSRGPEEGTATAAHQDQPDSEKRPTVKAMAVKRRNVQRTTRQPCSLAPAHQVTVEPRISGAVVEVQVDIGDRVKKDQVLARLDDAEIRAGLAKAEIQLRASELKQRQARAALAAAQAALKGTQAQLDEELRSDVKRLQAQLSYQKKETDRLQTLAEQRAIDSRLVEEAQAKLQEANAAVSVAEAKVKRVEALTQRDKAEVERASAGLESAELEVAAAKAELDLARSRHDVASITAPIGGIVSQRNAQVGSYARSASASNNGSRALFTIVQTDPIRAVVNVPETDIPYLEVGDPATVSFANRASPVIHAKVSRIAYSEDVATRTLRAEIDLPNPQGRLRPGQYGTVEIALEELKNVLAVPAEACFSHHDREGRTTWTCGVVRDQRFELVDVQLDEVVGTWAIVHAGLKEGDIVRLPFQDLPGEGPFGAPPLRIGERVNVEIVDPR